MKYAGEKYRLINRKIVEELLHYDPDNGIFIWKKRSGEKYFCGAFSKRSENAWNKRFAGKIAGSYKDGYQQIIILGHQFRAHHIVWLLENGRWPKREIDHINQNRSDNRICNLREVSHVENSKNQKMRSTNKSGQTGVSYLEDRNKWQAHITVSGKQLSLGLFEDFSKAVTARKKAENKYGFHKNHGVAA